MRFSLSVSLSLTSLLAAGGSAIAQPAAAQPEVAASARAERNWAIGVHLGGLGIRRLGGSPGG